MGQFLKFPPHVKTNGCRECKTRWHFDPRPCMNCDDGVMHAVRESSGNQTLLECSGCIHQMNEKIG
jgi:hypothetical protein